MPLESADFINDLTITNPAAGDVKGEGDDHLRLIKKALKATFPNLSGALSRLITKTANYTVLAADNTVMFNCKNGMTLALTAAATLGAGHMFGVFADANIVVIDPAGAELINGATSVSLPIGSWGFVYCTGTAFVLLHSDPVDLSTAWPVGSIYMNASVATNPATLLGFGTWAAFGVGRMPISLDSSNALFDTAGEVGGTADAVVVSHTHTITDPGHTHTAASYASTKTAGHDQDNVFVPNSSSTGSAVTGISVNTSGVSGVNANYPPFIAVYMWQRTA